jgi:hypothetical protein
LKTWKAGDKPTTPRRQAAAKPPDTSIHRRKKMRIAPKGKWFIRATDTARGNKFFPFYDGFNTKKEAQEMCDKLNKAQPGYIHEVVSK